MEFNRGDLIILERDLTKLNPEKVNLAPVWLITERGHPDYTLLNMSTNVQIAGSTHTFYHASEKIDEIIKDAEVYLNRLKYLRELAKR